ncbi:hypothetical protein SCATT_p06150 (plasmid) [Streptantibioticus cattleyicolor NRRL 8057 = DSM 46488]|uniref:Uncharacterized protein n=1 Tax=Streptantibioticus cattleyicolor (strain ATCC 35852 / DSM 46488 / JCM 4925 / NBRC 14057 / NRRL 8057) TaxID=1003195 RepID=G8XGY1_STREN|nr:hypothetical protein SCATT_p06150 [Streptantibioticus cattleyicolor NRRL 8057 = DSM 46488]
MSRMLPRPWLAATFACVRLLQRLHDRDGGARAAETGDADGKCPSPGPAARQRCPRPAGARRPGRPRTGPA